MEIKHHNIFQVYLPKNIGENGNLTAMLMEEAHLFSNGEMTPDYKANDDERSLMDVILYPSFVYAARQKSESEYEQTKEINLRIDVEFCKLLLWIKPIYKSTDFIEFHFQKCKKDKRIFLKHIKYVILPLIKQIIENDSEETKGNKYPQFGNMSEVINKWLDEKEELLDPCMRMKKENKFETNIGRAENVIVNNNSRVNDQKNGIISNKKTLQVIALIVSILMLIIALKINWDILFKKKDITITAIK